MRDVLEVISHKGSPWRTEASFWAWLRGGLRSGCWAKHPVKLNYIRAMRERVPLGKQTEGNPDGLVWGGKCAHCFRLFKQSDLEVDHKRQAAQKPLKDDLTGFITGMVFVTFDDLQLVCKPCHKVKSYAERLGITFAEAEAEKLAIEACKKSVKDQINLLTELGFDNTLTKNQKDRRECFLKHYLKHSG